jgi:hypothetical protein
MDHVNEQCCNHCMCSNDDFPRLSEKDCEAPCTLPWNGNGPPYTSSCSDRISWVKKYTSRGLKNGLDEVNKKCAGQCFCTIDDPSLQ